MVEKLKSSYRTHQTIVVNKDNKPNRVMKPLNNTINTLLVVVCFALTQFSFSQQSVNNENGSAMPEGDALNISSESDDDRLKIRLLFTSVGVINRQILLTVDDRATDGYDWGFDGYLNDVQVDDMSWIIEDQDFVIQGIGNIVVDETTLPLNIKKSDVGDIVISIQALENVPDDLDIYLHDSDLNTYHDLRQSNYQANLTPGQYDDRYQIVFQAPSVLSTTDNELEELDFYYAMSRNKVVILNPTSVELKDIEVYNISGQMVYTNNNIWSGSYGEYELQNLSSGAYIVRLNTTDNRGITKKIIVK